MNQNKLNQIFRIILFNSTLIVCCVLFNPLKSFSQPVQIGTPISEYLRLMNTRGQLSTNASWNLQPLQFDWLQIQESDKANPWKEIVSKEFNRKKTYSSDIQLYLYPSSFFQSYNTNVPAGGNDGALWQGRGYNTSFSTGFWLKFKFLEISLKPEFNFSENKEFELSPFNPRKGFSEFTEPLTRIDTPQRFGNSLVSEFDLGETFIEINTGPIEFGLSNSHQWLSPAIYNPIMMSNNGPGFQHVYLRTSKPIKSPIGYFESRIFLARLKESLYFDTDPSNNFRLLTAFYISYSPSFLENISFGLSRTYYESWPIEGIGFKDITRLFGDFYKENFSTEENPEGNDQADQLLSFMARWVFPDSGHEIYFEYVRNDHAWDFRDFILEVDHAKAFTIGSIATRNLSGHSLLKFNLEITQLENPKTGSFRGFPILYSHKIKNGGYAQKGQVLGASIGPGSNSQILNIDYYDKWGKVGVFTNRIVHNNDQLYDRIRAIQRFTDNSYSLQFLHDVELRIGISATTFIRKIALTLDMWRGEQYNRYNIHDNNQSNYHVSLKLQGMFF